MASMGWGTFLLFGMFDILVALFTIALEYPLPFLKGTMIYRSIPLRVVWLLWQAFLAVLFYQVHLSFSVILFLC